MVDNLHIALESRAVIEQAKGILHAELGVSPAEAFRLLSRYSQNTTSESGESPAGLSGDAFGRRISARRRSDEQPASDHAVSHGLP
jgi:hypothetical protein